MSAAASTATPTTEPSRSGRLLDLLRRLIDYGRELATTLHQRAAAEAEARPAGLPTPGQIAAQVRRQPIGAVIADN